MYWKTCIILRYLLETIHYLFQQILLLHIYLYLTISMKKHPKINYKNFWNKSKPQRYSSDNLGRWHFREIQNNLSGSAVSQHPKHLPSTNIKYTFHFGFKISIILSNPGKYPPTLILKIYYIFQHCDDLAQTLLTPIFMFFLIPWFTYNDKISETILTMLALSPS